MSAACGSISSPVVTSVMRMPKRLQLRCRAPRDCDAAAARRRSASPAARAARGSRRRAARDRPSEISRLSALAFQMSHITQRQLQALCTLSARIGRLSSRCVTRLRARRAISPGPPSVQHLEAGFLQPHLRARAGRSSARRAAAIRRARAGIESTPVAIEHAAPATAPPRTARRRSSSGARRCARRVTSVSNGQVAIGRSTVRSAGAPTSMRPPPSQPQQLRGAGADRARQPFGAQLPRRVRRLQFIEQVAARRSIANRSPAPADPHRQTRARRRSHRTGTGSTRDTRPGRRRRRSRDPRRRGRTRRRE